MVMLKGVMMSAVSIKLPIIFHVWGDDDDGAHDLGTSRSLAVERCTRFSLGMNHGQ